MTTQVYVNDGDVIIVNVTPGQGVTLTFQVLAEAEAPAESWWDVDLRDVLPRRANCPPPLQNGWWPRTLAQINGVTMHHTLALNVTAVAQGYIGRDGGRPSIPYHLWVTRDGEVAYCLDLTEGCWHDHTGHQNTHVSVGLAGVLDVTPPTEAQVWAAARVVRGLLALLPGVTLGSVRGHRDYIATRCPGWGQPPQYHAWRAAFYAVLV